MQSIPKRLRPVSLQTPAPLDRPLAETLIDRVGHGIDAPLLFMPRVHKQVQLSVSPAYKVRRRHPDQAHRLKGLPSPVVGDCLGNAFQVMSIVSRLGPVRVYVPPSSVSGCATTTASWRENERTSVPACVSRRGRVRIRNR